MTRYKQHEMKLQVMIDDGWDLVDEFRHRYKQLQELFADIPKSMTAERKSTQELMLEMAAQSRDLKAALKEANQCISSITGHYAWKKAVEACFGEEGMAKCYAYFDGLNKPKE